MPESLIGDIRDKFQTLTNRGGRRKVIDSSEKPEESPKAKPWDAHLAACARSQACRNGLIPEIEDRIETFDRLMGLAENHELPKIVGARDALRSLKERLLQGEEHARQAEED